jgi:hypothetical protein
MTDAATHHRHPGGRDAVLGISITNAVKTLSDQAAKRYEAVGRFVHSVVIDIRQLSAGHAAQYHPDHPTGDCPARWLQPLGGYGYGFGHGGVGLLGTLLIVVVILMLLGRN